MFGDTELFVLLSRKKNLHLFKADRKKNINPMRKIIRTATTGTTTAITVLDVLSLRKKQKKQNYHIEGTLVLVWRYFLLLVNQQIEMC